MADKPSCAGCIPASSCVGLALLVCEMRILYAHHDRLALVLDDVTRATDFVTAAKAEKHEFIGGIYGVVVLGRHGRCLSLCRHDYKAASASYMGDASSYYRDWCNVG